MRDGQYQFPQLAKGAIASTKYLNTAYFKTLSFVNKGAGFPLICDTVGC